jgi:hypothetical protein
MYKDFYTYASDEIDVEETIKNIIELIESGRVIHIHYMPGDKIIKRLIELGYLEYEPTNERQID